MDELIIRKVTQITHQDAGNLEIPEFTADKTLAKEFDSKDTALTKGRFFAGKYGYGVDEV